MPSSAPTHPGHPGLLARQPLLARLAAAQGKALWIGAPAGYGKSSLALAFASQQGRALWLRLAPGDADPASFFARLAQAAGCRLPPMQPEQLREPAAYARQAWAALWAQQPGALLVLDELETVAEPLQAVLAEGVASLPPEAWLLMTSRLPPPAALVRALSQQRLLLLGSAQLTLTRGEVALLASQRGQVLDAVGLDALMLQTQGWPAAVMLALLAASRRPTPDPVLLGQYLQHEVWPGFDETTRELLQLAALLPAVTPALEEAWPRLQGVQALMKRFNREGFFVLAEQGPRWVLHPLLREFLHQQASQPLAASSLRPLQLEAAQALQQVGEAEAAMGLLLAAQAWQPASALLQLLAPRLLAQSRFAVLASWLTALPRELRLAEPALAYWSGLLHLMTAPGQARQHLLRALAGYAERQDATGQLRTLAPLAYLSFVDCTPDFPMTHWLPALKRLAPSFEQLSSRDEQAQVATTVLHALLVGEPAHPELPQWRARLLSLLAAPIGLSVRLRGASVLGIHLLWSGRHDELLALHALLAPALQQPGLSDYNRLIWGLVELDACWASGRLLEAAPLLSSLRHVAAQCGIHSLDTYHQLLASDALLAAGQLDAAEALMQQARQTLLPAQVTEIWHLALQQAWAALWRRDAAMLAVQAQAAIEAGRAIGSPICEALGWMARGQAELLRGELGALRALLPELEQQAARAGSRMADALLALLQACAAPPGSAAERAHWRQLKQYLAGLRHPVLFTQPMLDALAARQEP